MFIIYIFILCFKSRTMLQLQVYVLREHMPPPTLHIFLGEKISLELCKMFCNALPTLNATTLHFPYYSTAPALCFLLPQASKFPPNPLPPGEGFTDTRPHFAPISFSHSSKLTKIK